MAIETIDDIVEEIMDNLCIYGSHDPVECTEINPCRCCASSKLTERLQQAFIVQEKLKA